MSIVTQAFIVEKYGVRLDTEQLADLLSISPAALRNQITLGTCGIKTYREGKKRWADYRDDGCHVSLSVSLMYHFSDDTTGAESDSLE